MDKLKLAHDYLLKIMSNSPLVDQVDIEFAVSTAWSYARMMHSENIKEDKTDSEQKRKEIREMLNAPNTFVEREGQHFDDVADIQKPYTRSEEWQPDWSKAPDNMTHFAVDKNGSGWFFNREPHAESDCCWYCGDDSAELDNHNYQGNWQNSLRKRPQ